MCMFHNRPYIIGWLLAYATSIVCTIHCASMYVLAHVFSELPVLLSVVTMVPSTIYNVCSPLHTDYLSLDGSMYV